MITFIKAKYTSFKNIMNGTGLSRVPVDICKLNETKKLEHEEWKRKITIPAVPEPVSDLPVPTYPKDSVLIGYVLNLMRQ